MNIIVSVANSTGLGASLAASTQITEQQVGMKSSYVLKGMCP